MYNTITLFFLTFMAYHISSKGDCNKSFNTPSIFLLKIELKASPKSKFM